MHRRAAGIIKLRTLYNIAFQVFFVLASPYYFWRLIRRGNWVDGFGQRFARYDRGVNQALTNRHVIWIHAVSVGEVGLCTQLIRAMEPRAPNVKFVVSCTTTTGMQEYRRRLPAHILKIYYPVDRSRYVRRAIAVINPQAIILLEAEIWPNFIWRARDLRLPLFLANARLSDRSFPRYRRHGWLFRDLFGSFSGVGCQSEKDAARLVDVGCRPDAVKVVGNLKFDAAKASNPRKLDVREMLRSIGVSENAPVLVAGSTHDGEEAMLVDIAAHLRKKFPSLFLILVPRHFERTKALVQQLRGKGARLAVRSEVEPSSRSAQGSVDVLLVNTTGELVCFYEAASVVFVGKSLTAKGGQNPLEPASLGKPVVFGPNMQNFKDIVRILMDHQAAVSVRDSRHLEETLADLLGNPQRCADLGARALAAVHSNQGAVNRTVEMILPHLQARGIYVTPSPG